MQCNVRGHKLLCKMILNSACIVQLTEVTVADVIVAVCCDNLGVFWTRDTICRLLDVRAHTRSPSIKRHWVCTGSCSLSSYYRLSRTSAFHPATPLTPATIHCEFQRNEKLKFKDHERIEINKKEKNCKRPPTYAREVF